MMPIARGGDIVNNYNYKEGITNEALETPGHPAAPDESSGSPRTDSGAEVAQRPRIDLHKPIDLADVVESLRHKGQPSVEPGKAQGNQMADPCA